MYIIHLCGHRISCLLKLRKLSEQKYQGFCFGPRFLVSWIYFYWHLNWLHCWSAKLTEIKSQFFHREHILRFCLRLYNVFLFSFPRYNGYTKESSFSIGLQGVHKDDVDKVKQIIEETIDKVIKYVLLILLLKPLWIKSLIISSFVW